MIIDPKGTILGFPSMTVRKVVRNIDVGDRWTHWRSACKSLPIGEAQELTTLLHRSRYIRKHPKNASLFQRTNKGQRLALAHARGIKRSTANRMLLDLLSRARDINLDPYYCYKVKYLVLFGSYVGGKKDVLGDLDVGFMLSNRYLTKKKQVLVEQERCRNTTRKFSSELDRRLWPYREVYLALKNRTPNLSLHDMNCEGEKNIILSGSHMILKIPQ